MRKISSHILLITILGIIIYSNTLNSSFVFDDAPYITNNSMIRNLPDSLKLSGTRYITFLTFALNYSLGGYNTFGYHVLNLIIHILNAMLVYWLVVLTFSTPFFQTSGSEPDIRQHNHLIALFSGLLFISHPIQTQAVTYISQRFTSLATFFYLLSLVMYIKWRITIQSTESREQRAESRLYAIRYTLYAASIISAILAMETKEISFTLPFIITLYEFCFFNKSPDSKLGDPKLKRFLYLLPFLLTLIIIPLTIIGMEWTISNPEVDIGLQLRHEQLKDVKTLSKYSYLLTQMRVIVTYIRLLFIPINQHFLYNYPVFHSFLKPQVFLSFLFLSLIFCSGVYLLYISRIRLMLRLIAFGILWFFITLSVESSIMPIQHVIFEHRLYLPSIGIIVSFVSGIFYVLRFKFDNSQKLHKAAYLLLAAVVLSLSAAAYQRNIIWKDEISLWKDSIRIYPNNMDAHNNLGFVYHNQGRLEEAIQEYLTALLQKPDNTDLYKIHGNLGRAYYDQNRFNEALKEFKTVLKLKPGDIDSHNYIGNIYYKQGLYDKAIQELNAALEPTPDSHSFDNVHHINHGNLTQATINNLWAYQPCFAGIHFDLGRIYRAQGNIDKAARKFKVATVLRPGFVEAHYNLGNVYQKQGKLDEAIKEYQAVLKINPNHADARNKLETLSK